MKSNDQKMSNKKRVVVLPLTTDETTAEDHHHHRRGWESMNPEILSLIFVRLASADEMVRSVLSVCKPWMETVAGPWCWKEIDVRPWCHRRPEVDADLLVRKLIRWSKFTVQRLSTYFLREEGFFVISSCGRSLKVLEIPRSSITDQMVLKHIKPLPNLEVLDISHCYRITHKGIAAFGTHCRSLVDLKRNMWPLMLEEEGDGDDSEAKAIAATMVGLRRIELRYGRFGDLGVSEILTKCKWLNHLDIEGCRNVELELGGGDVRTSVKDWSIFRAWGWFTKGLLDKILDTYYASSQLRLLSYLLDKILDTYYASSQLRLDPNDCN
ncbi:hypothetical protein OSB04_012899 [Centaurea solstitialis]|uniref:F-box protein n=1 Tax=Centaurea solstitialis TaxID=347529 RepID=A0AA38TC74_9ASTR|nr:hypothetical protein OSB04_012899 [Centaurea solstitialis]